ncbi:MAG TPA: OmpA family protein [Candidatus Sumerlaeota bacterium]|nr:OmpA family protein [Candidatus Sumerlaeota bacterium]HPS00279.1 OmpA family protein [Candidatus Sumerlaeota bacterium]
MFKQSLQILLVVALSLSMLGCKSCRKNTNVKNEGPAVTVPGETGDGQGGPRPGSENKVRIPESDVKTVYFDYDRSEIKGDQKTDLEKSAEFLKSDKAKGRTVLIEGHCDERGTLEYNMALGQRRADSVKAFLVSRGVDGNKLTTLSRGKEAPAVQGTGEEVWKKNRRCEFYYTN